VPDYAAALLRDQGERAVFAPDRLDDPRLLLRVKGQPLDLEREITIAGLLGPDRDFGLCYVVAPDRLGLLNQGPRF
jgi:hypothetical protein